MSFFKKTKNILAVKLAVLMVLVMGSCYTDKEELLYPGSTQPINCITTNAKYAADVQPIILNKCAIAGCHDATASGGAIFQTYSQVSAKKDRVNVRAVVEKTMPPTGALSPDEQAKIKCWIDAGGLNN